MTLALIRPVVLGLAAVMAAPAMYRAFVTEELDVGSALTRFLLAVPAAAIMVALLTFVTADYGERRGAARAGRRRTDRQPPPEGGTEQQPG